MAGSADLGAYYRFSTGALTTDSSSRGHTLTDISVPVENPYGVFGGAVSLQGDDAFSAVDHADFKPTGSFSIGYWVQTTSGSGYHFASYSQNTNYAGIICGTTSGGYPRIYIGYNTGTVAGTDFATFNTIGNPNGFSISDGAWHHVLWVYDGTYINCYQDGVFAGQTLASAPAYAATNYVRIGCRNNTGTNVNFTTGFLDDVWIFNGYALTAEDAYRLFNDTSHSPSFSPSFSPSISPSISPSVSPSISESPSLSPSVSPSVSLSPSVSPSISVSPSVSPSISLSPSISPSLSPSISPSVSPSVSISPSVSPSISVSPSQSPSVSPSLSPSVSPSVSESPSVSPSFSPSETEYVTKYTDQGDTWTNKYPATGILLQTENEECILTESSLYIELEQDATASYSTKYVVQGDGYTDKYPQAEVVLTTEDGDYLTTGGGLFLILESGATSFTTKYIYKGTSYTNKYPRI